MLDATARKLIDPSLNAVGKMLASRGMTADGVTLVGLAVGLLAAFLIMLGWTGAALICLLYTSPSPRDKRQSRMPSSA